MKRESIQLYVPSELKVWLQEYAKRHDLTMTTVVKTLLEREAAKDKAAAPEKLLYWYAKDI